MEFLNDPTALLFLTLSVAFDSLRPIRALSPPVLGESLTLEFEVCDTGVGISAESRENLFQPFAQMERSTTRRYGGTGLGLMLSKELAVALGGNLELKSSAPDRGCVFAFTIDGGVVRGELTPGAVPAVNVNAEVNPAMAAFQGKSVLLVEDSPDNRLMLTRYLISLGFMVETAADGIEALDKVKVGNYDLILMDIQMPRLDGHETAKILRSFGFTKPLLAITAHAFKEDRERAFTSGFDDYLIKPVQRSVLVKAIARRLMRPELH